MVIKYKPSFLRDFKKLPKEIQMEAKEKINLFKDPSQHDRLRVHQIKGKLKDFYSFSITYSHRLVFQYEDNKAVVFLAIGTHEVYR